MPRRRVSPADTAPLWWLGNNNPKGTPPVSQEREPEPEPEPEPAPTCRPLRVVLRSTEDQLVDDAFEQASARAEAQVTYHTTREDRRPSKTPEPDRHSVGLPMPDFWAWRAPGNRFVQPHKRDRQLLSHQIRR